MITACLITYLRPRNVAPIVDHLLSQQFIESVIVRNMECNNTRAYGRYEIAQTSLNDEVYTQDDDCIVHDIANLYEQFRLDPCRITFGLHPSHYPLWQNKSFTYPEGQLAMMGWGAFFKRAWIGPAFFRYRERYPQDLFMEREADRIFSVLLGRQHNPVLTPNLEHLPGASAGAAMSLEGDHYRSRDLAIDRCLKILRRK